MTRQLRTTVAEEDAEESTGRGRDRGGSRAEEEIQHELVHPQGAEQSRGVDSRGAWSGEIKIAGLDRFFDEMIVPTEMVTEFKGGKKRVVKRKLYPGYIVVHMEINDDTWFAGARDAGHRRFHRLGRQAHADAAARSGADRRQDRRKKTERGAEAEDQASRRAIE